LLVFTLRWKQILQRWHQLAGRLMMSVVNWAQLDLLWWREYCELPGGWARLLILNLFSRGLAERA
jgi:hypothetical protein